MSKRLVIVGAGGFGREVHAWVKSSPRWRASAGVGTVVFIDDLTPEVPVRAPIVSKVSEYMPAANDVVLCAIGVPAVRRKIMASLAARGAKVATFIHDRAVLGDNVTVGAGSVICPNVMITCDVLIGESVHINIGSTIGHDVAVGDFATLSPACNLNGNVQVEDDAFLGTAATVIPGCRIGAGSLVGAGSVVVKDVPRGSTVFGSPARVMGKRSE